MGVSTDEISGVRTAGHTITITKAARNMRNPNDEATRLYMKYSRWLWVVIVLAGTVLAILFHFKGLV